MKKRFFGMSAKRKRVVEDAFIGSLVVNAAIAVQAGSSMAVMAAAATADNLGGGIWKKQGRNLRGGEILPPKLFHWRRVDILGDDLKFLHFTALTRSSFKDLVRAANPFIEKMPLKEECVVPKYCYVCN